MTQNVIGCYLVNECNYHKTRYIAIAKLGVEDVRVVDVEDVEELFLWQLLSVKGHTNHFVTCYSV